MHDRARLVKDLRALGLQSGDDVMVHSSFKSLGGVVGGPPTVVEALLEVVGPEGTLVVPTFTHSGTTHFDPLVSPSHNGAITEAARAHPRALRSWHPTHAVTAIGPAAAELVRDDLERGALGRVSKHRAVHYAPVSTSVLRLASLHAAVRRCWQGCALDKHAQRGGWVLLLGVDHSSDSTIHIGEDYGGDDRHAGGISPATPKRIVFTHPVAGDEMEVVVTSMMGNVVLARHEELDSRLREGGRQAEGLVANAQSRLVRGSHIVEECVAMMREAGVYHHRL
jgi:aminoglycoside 3-N-acetyltransferase